LKDAPIKMKKKQQGRKEQVLENENGT